MNETISKYIKGCVMCATRKPSNIKLRLYTPLMVPSQPWESISMDFVGDFSMSMTCHGGKIQQDVYSNAMQETVRWYCKSQI
jgi:hypothetical protein